MTTHTKTILAVLGVCMGIVIGEKTVFGSETIIVSLLLIVVQVGVYYGSVIAKNSFFLAKIFGTKRRQSSDDNNKESKEPEEEVDGSPTVLKNSQVLVATIIVATALLVGASRVQFIESPSRIICTDACVVEGRVISEPEVKDEYQVFDVNVRGTVGDDDVSNIRVRVPLYPEYHVGETLTLQGKILPPKIIYSHGMKKSFDYDTYLLINNVGSEMYYPHVVNVTEGKKSFTEILMAYKESLLTRINMYVGEPSSALASGMLLGNTQMSGELTETFRVAGLSHIVVLSGFNIAILIAALLLLLKPLPLVLRVGVAGVTVVLFVLMVGGEASVVRATLMAFVSLLALLLGRGYVAHQALLLSFLCIILYSPLTLLYDVSLHLSFLATGGLVYMNDGMKKLCEKIPFGIYKEIVSTSLSAYLATLPYVMYTFGTMSVYGVVTNLMVLPLVPLIMLLTFITVLLSYISSTLAYGIGYIVTSLSDSIIWIARTIEGLPFASLAVTVTFYTACFMYLFIFGVYTFLVTRIKNETLVTKEGESISGVISY